MVRIARIKVAPEQLDKNNNALKAQMQEAFKKEPGVLSYHAVAEKKIHLKLLYWKFMLIHPLINYICSPLILNEYKETVKDMVLKLELIHLDLIARADKIKN